MLPLPLPMDEPTLRQRDRHFQRREKVLGQFFTPPPLAAWMVEVSLRFLNRRESMLDPACGEGVFLAPALACGFSRVVGVELDPEALAACRRRLGDAPALSLRPANALDLLHELEGQFDLVATNPPFSAKYGRVREARWLQPFALGAGRRSEAIEVLFLELSVRALGEGGVLAIVLPEGLFANLPHRRVREWLIRQAEPIALVSLSRRFFPAKTSILIARKGAAVAPAPVWLAHAEDEGDLQRILDQLASGGGIRKPVADLLDDMAPLHHLRPPEEGRDGFGPWAFPLRPLKELLDAMRGGRAEYGARRKFAETGLPFLSARTITPFGIDLRRDGRRIAPGSPMDHPGARVRRGDVLFVRVGVGCIGRAAVVLEEDEEGIADDYLYILRFRPDRMAPEFFALLAQTRFFRQQLERIWRGTGTLTVPQRLLREVQVPTPPREAQERFAAAYRELHRRYRQGTASEEERAAWIRCLENFLMGARTRASGEGPSRAAIAAALPMPAGPGTSAAPMPASGEARATRRLGSPPSGIPLPPARPLG